MLTTKPAHGGILSVYCRRARVGYITQASKPPDYIWELSLFSEHHRGLPRGYAPSREAALEKIQETLELWMRAAGMEWSR